ncbi:MAG: hypothetical protein HY842_20155, partial [Bacteroidetes bacterium]|nr:hypothetical protein [Bacteroidota bacterium]
MDEKFEAIIEGILADNYATCEDFFDEDLIAGLRNNLLNRHATGQMHQAGVGRQGTFQQDLKVRGDVISWMDDQPTEPHYRAFLDLIELFYRYLNRTCF